jgi:hypothetical protein
MESTKKEIPMNVKVENLEGLLRNAQRLREIEKNLYQEKDVSYKRRY